MLFVALKQFVKKTSIFSVAQFNMNSAFDGPSCIPSFKLRAVDIVTATILWSILSNIGNVLTVEKLNLTCPKSSPMERNNKNIKKYRNSTCWFILIAIAILWSLVLPNMQFPIMTRLGATNGNRRWRTLQNLEKKQCKLLCKSQIPIITYHQWSLNVAKANQWCIF